MRITILLLLLTLSALASPRVYLNLDPPVVIGGETAEATLALSEPAPATGLDVYLLSGQEVDLPRLVEVEAGVREVSFPVETAPVSRRTPVRIRARSAGVVQHQHLTLTPQPSNPNYRVKPRLYSPYYPNFYSPWFQPQLRPRSIQSDARLTPLERLKSKSLRGPSKIE